MCTNRADDPANTLENWKRNAQIEHLLETGGRKSPAKLAGEIEGVLRGLLQRDVKWQINAAINTIFPSSGCEVASRYPYTTAEVVIRRILRAEEAGISERLREGLLNRVSFNAEFTHVIQGFVRFVPGRNGRLVGLVQFVDHCLSNFRAAELQNLAQELQGSAGDAMKALALDVSARSIVAAVILGSLGGESVQEQLVSLLREHYAQGDAQMGDAIHDGLMQALPAAVQRLCDRAVEAFRAWGAALAGMDSEEDQLLGSALVKVCLAELASRRSS